MRVSAHCHEIHRPTHEFGAINCMTKCVVKCGFIELITCNLNSKPPLTLLSISLSLQPKNAVIGNTHRGKQEANTSQLFALRPKWRHSVGHGVTPGKEHYDLVASLVPTALRPS